MLVKQINRFHLPYAMLFLVSLGSSMMPPLLGPLFLHQYGFLSHQSQYIRFNAYGLTIGIYFIGTTLGGFFCGLLSDRIGAKKTLFFCLWGSIFSCVISVVGLIYSSLLLFFFSRALDGVMSGRRAAILSLLSSLKEPKTTVFRIAEIMNAAGLFIGPILCGFLVDFNGKVPLYYYSSPLIIILFMTTINIVLNFQLKDNHQPYKEENSTLKWREIYQHSIFIEFLLYQLAWYLYFIAVIPFAMIGLKFNSYYIGVLFSSMVVCYILSLVLTYELSFKKLAESLVKKIAIITLVLSFLCIALFKANILVFLLGNIGVIFSASILTPFYLANISKIFPGENQGVVMGIQSSIIGISSAIAALISGTLLDLSINLPFFVAAVLVGFIYINVCYKL